MAKPTPDFTLEDLEASLRELEERQKENGKIGFLTSELGEYLDCSEEVARKKVKQMREAGIIVPAKVERQSVWGHATKYLGYVMVGKEEKP